MRSLPVLRIHGRLHDRSLRPGPTSTDPETVLDFVLEDFALGREMVIDFQSRFGREFQYVTGKDYQ